MATIKYFQSVSLELLLKIDLGLTFLSIKVT